MSPRTAALALALLLPALAQAVPPRSLRARYAPGEVLVKFRAGTPAVRRAAAVASHAHLPRATLGHDWAHVSVAVGETVEEAIAAYASDPDVEEAQPNYRYQALAVPAEASTGLFAQEWWLENTGQSVGSSPLQAGHSLRAPTTGTAGADIDVVGAWDWVTDCSSVVVAVIDTGVAHGHQDLAANMWDGGATYPNHGWDFVDGDDDPADLNGHGTHVAGIIGGAANGIGTVGVCWKASLMAVRVLDAMGAGYTDAIMAGIDFATEHGAKVINMSLGSSERDAAMEAAVNRAADAGVLVVVAAGNDGTNDDAVPVYPCGFASPAVLCVAALDQDLALADFSNFGRRSVDVGAPGVNVLSTWAGTNAVLSEPLTGAGWSLGAGSGWGFGTETFSDGSGGSFALNFLANPASWSHTTYAVAAEHHAWKAFDTSGADVVTASFYASVNVSAGDHLRVACRSAGGDPFAGGVLLEDLTDVHTGGSFGGLGLDLAACASPSSTLGFQLQSQAPGASTDWGAALVMMSVEKLALNGTSYNTIAGTSMASPVVAGIAALLRAYHPAFTPADVITALDGGGLALPALATKLRTGKAVRATGALTHVAPPANLGAVVHSAFVSP